MAAQTCLWIVACGPESNRWSAIGPRVVVGGLSSWNGQRTGVERTKNGWGTDKERICKAGTDL